jgi:hypothetical protein
VRVGLRLSAIGYGSTLVTLGGSPPRASANRVFYTRPALSEWYSNGPLGVEQGFVLARAPAGEASGPLTLAVAITGNGREAIAAGGRAVTFTDVAGIGLRYGELIARDADGHTLHSWIELKPGRLLLRVDARAARYPLTIDPLIQQGGKLTGTTEVGAGAFGFSVAISSDGSTALIGGPADNATTGAAWVFTRSGSTWTQQAKLIGSGGSGSPGFGSSVALSSDGSTALVGGPLNKERIGAAWVFTRSGTSWTQQQELTATGESGAGLFGSSVALSSEGDTALVGGAADSSSVGAAWAFTRSGTTWTQQQELTATGESGAGNFGYSAALSSDGNTALIGAPANNGIVGAAWAFTRSGTSWTQQQELTATGESGAGDFGYSAALSSDGNTALLGGPADNGGIGAAWPFTRAGSTWSQQGAKLTGAGEVGEGRFGQSVALSAEANAALIGGDRDNHSVGAAWAFTRSGTMWTRQNRRRVGGGESGKGFFGESVALSSTGNLALIGGPQDNEGVGAVWFFEQMSVAPPTATTRPASPVGATSATLHGTVNPAGSSSECVFEYGTTEAYESTAACTPSPGSSSTPVEVAAPVGALSANTTYHFRVSVTNEGSTSSGADEVFKTSPPENPPTVATGEATAITQTSATLNATVNPNAAEVTECKFEYGLTTAYGLSALCSPPPGSGVKPVAVSAPVPSLVPNATYHFRAVATSTIGTSHGVDKTFKTAQSAGPPPTVKRISPKKGPAAGGSAVTITGSGFSAVSAVAFGSATAPSFTVNSETSITAVSPPGKKGTVDVTVTVGSGTSAHTKKDRFKYSR